jgi:hypothetical protein
MNWSDLIKEKEDFDIDSGLKKFFQYGATILDEVCFLCYHWNLLMAKITRYGVLKIPASAVVSRTLILLYLNLH